MLVVMHMRGTPRTMQPRPHYDDVVREVGDELRARVDAARRGRRRAPTRSSPTRASASRKTAEHNLALLARAARARGARSRCRCSSARRASRSSAASLGDAPVDERDEATLATTVWCFVHGAAVVRVHDVAASSRARRDAARRDGTRDADGRIEGWQHEYTTGLRGRWAQGLQPRYFTWVIMDRLGAGERPGGFARNHRKVRRQEELIWLSVHGFTHVVSLLDSPHNLHAYEEAGLAYVHVPLGPHDELVPRLEVVYAHDRQAARRSRPRSCSCTTRSSATACSA